MFKPRPDIVRVPIDAEHSCYVIDDALQEPERWVEYAANARSAFQREDFNAYPGFELRMPDAVSARLDEYFMLHIRHLLGVRRTLRMYSRLAMVTDAPESLEPRQWICHRDRMAVPPEQCVAASVLYLFKEGAYSGTSFFRPIRSKQDTDVLVHDSGTLPRAEFIARYGLSPGYPSGSNAWFEKLCTVPARWNRLIFYDGSLFHCADIGADAPLSDDPRTGRLTLNGFFTCRRSARIG